MIHFSSLSPSKGHYFLLLYKFHYQEDRRVENSLDSLLLLMMVAQDCLILLSCFPFFTKASLSALSRPLGNNECLTKFVQTQNASSSVKTASDLGAQAR